MLFSLLFFLDIFFFLVFLFCSSIFGFLMVNDKRLNGSLWTSGVQYTMFYMATLYGCAPRLARTYKHDLLRTKYENENDRFF